MSAWTGHAENERIRETMSLISATGIPLTFLQLAIHHHHPGVTPDLSLIANNFVVAHAIYDADRIPRDEGFWSTSRLSTHLSALASIAFFAHDPALSPLAPAVGALHFYDHLKPLIAPAKPFVVAFFWTVACYYLPLWNAHVTQAIDVFEPASFFLFIVTLSHVFDIKDIEEDDQRDIDTPAVRMGVDESLRYAIALSLATIYCNTQSNLSCDVLDIGAICVAIAFFLDAKWPAATLFVAGLLVYAGTHREDLLEQMIMSSDTTHKMALRLTIDGIDFARQLPSPYNEKITKLIFEMVHAGDAYGSKLLMWYEHIIRHL